jgi:hypothetical protein
LGKGNPTHTIVLGCSLGIPANTDSIRQAKGIQTPIPYRAVARSKNPGGLVVLGGDNVPPLVEIGLTDLTKTGGAKAP